MKTELEGGGEEPIVERDKKTEELEDNGIMARRKRRKIVVFYAHVKGKKRKKRIRFRIH